MPPPTFPRRTRWAGVDAELVGDMAAQAAEVAGWYPSGTGVHRFDRRTEEWVFSPVSA